MPVTGLPHVRAQEQEHQLYADYAKVVLASAARERLAALLQRPDVCDALRVRRTRSSLAHRTTRAHSLSHESLALLMRVTS